MTENDFIFNENGIDLFDAGLKYIKFAKLIDDMCQGIKIPFDKNYVILIDANKLDSSLLGSDIAIHEIAPLYIISNDTKPKDLVEGFLVVNKIDNNLNSYIKNLKERNINVLKVIAVCEFKSERVILDVDSNIKFLLNR